jgi:hypothetical protein
MGNVKFTKQKEIKADGCKKSSNMTFCAGKARGCCVFVMFDAARRGWESCLAGFADRVPMEWK